MSNEEKHAERVVEDFRRVPETAAENAPVDIKIAGRVFPFAEPVAMKAQLLRGEGLRLWSELGLMRIYSHQEAAKENGSPNKGLVDEVPLEAMADLLEGLPKLLAFLGKALKFTEANRKQIEDVICDPVITELVSAHSTIMEVLNRPTNGGPPGTVQETPTEAASTNGKPEMP